MRRLLLILAALTVTLSAAANDPVVPGDSLAVIPSEVEESQVDIPAIIFGHIGDDYEWHLLDTPWGPVVLHLPIIVHSKTSGWHCFSSGRLEHGESHEGFYIGENGKVM